MDFVVMHLCMDIRHDNVTACHIATLKWVDQNVYEKGRKSSCFQLLKRNVRERYMFTFQN